MYFALGLTETTMSELFCNGIPFGITVDGTPNYTQPLTNHAGFALAITHLDSAIDLSGGAKAGNATAAAGIKNASLIAKARTLVDQGKFAEAATLVGRGADVVPVHDHLLAGQHQQSHMELGLPASSARFAVSDSFDTQGIVKNAIPFGSTKDPRVPTTGSPTDKTKLGIDKLTPWVTQKIWTTREAPIVMVSGIDARLIEAEAKLQANDIAGMTTILNTLRTTQQTLGVFKPATMAALATPATQGCGGEPVLPRESVLAVCSRSAAERHASSHSPVREDAGSGVPGGAVPQGRHLRHRRQLAGDRHRSDKSALPRLLRSEGVDRVSRW